MDNSWPPKNAPKADEHFKDASRHENSKSEDASKKPVTRKELEALQAQRRTAGAAHTLKPPPGCVPLHKMEDKKREERIKKMKERLDKYLGKARDDFNRSI